MDNFPLFAGSVLAVVVASFAPEVYRRAEEAQKMPPFEQLRAGDKWRSWELLVSDVEPKAPYNPCQEFAGARADQA